MIICGPALLARSTFVRIRSTVEGTMCRPSTAHQSPAFGWQCPMNGCMVLPATADRHWHCRGITKRAHCIRRFSTWDEAATQTAHCLPARPPSTSTAPLCDCTRQCPACLRQGPHRAAPASASRWPWPSPWAPSVPVPDLLQVALRHCRITPRNTMTHLAQPAGANSQLRHWPFCTNPLRTFSTCLCLD